MKILIPLREAVAQLVQSVTSPTPLNGGAILGGAGGVLAIMFGAGASRLWVVVLIVMLVDLTAGLLRTLVTPGARVQGSVFLGGFLGKLLLLLLVPAAGAVDEVASMVPAIRDVMEGLPATSAVLVALIIREVASIVENVKLAKGDLPVLSIFTRAIGTARVPGGDS
jgi:hypothetical protein